MNPDINCPMCKVPHRPYNFSLTSEKIISSSSTCMRESYSEKETVYQDVINSIPSYYQTYIDNFKSIANGLVIL